MTATNLARLPAPYGEFARGYRRGLAAGIDLLEARDAINECAHGRLPDYTGWSCECWAANRPAGALPPNYVAPEVPHAA